MIEALWPSSWRIDPRANRTIWGDAGTKVAIVGTALLPVMLVGFTIYVAFFAEFGNVANLYCARRRWKEAKRDLGQHGGHLPPQRMFWYHDISDFLAVLQQEGHIWFTLVSFCILCFDSYVMNSCNPKVMICELGFVDWSWNCVRHLWFL